MSKDTAAIRDQLGRDPDTFQVLNADYYENIGMEEGTTVIKTHYIGHSFILGHPTNGVLGIANGVDGEQIVLGEAGRLLTIVRVTNPNYIYHEHFTDEDFKDTATADWDTTNFRIAMSSNPSHVPTYNTEAVSTQVALNDGTITQVKVIATETLYDSDEVIKYFVKTSSGGSWEEVTNGQTTTLAASGTELYFKITFLGNGGTATYIENLDINYG